MSTSSPLCTCASTLPSSRPCSRSVDLGTALTDALLIHASCVAAALESAEQQRTLQRPVVHSVTGARVPAAVGVLRLWDIPVASDAGTAQRRSSHQQLHTQNLGRELGSGGELTDPSSLCDLWFIMLPWVCLMQQNSTYRAVTANCPSPPPPSLVLFFFCW